jgi:hypothetical protein
VSAVTFVPMTKHWHAIEGTIQDNNSDNILK